jgi:hypothetical protein
MGHCLDNGNLVAISACSIRRFRPCPVAHASKRVCPEPLVTHPTGHSYSRSASHLPAAPHLLRILADEDLGVDRLGAAKMKPKPVASWAGIVQWE